QVLGRNCRFLQGPQTDPSAVALIRQAVEEERDASVTVLNFKADGTPFYNQFFVAPLWNRNKVVVNYVGVQVPVPGPCLPPDDKTAGISSIQGQGPHSQQTEATVVVSKPATSNASKSESLPSEKVVVKSEKSQGLSATVETNPVGSSTLSVESSPPPQAKSGVDVKSSPYPAAGCRSDLSVVNKETPEEASSCVEGKTRTMVSSDAMSSSMAPQRAPFAIKTKEVSSTPMTSTMSTVTVVSTGGGAQ
ncbi:unnamed protein product, partial [Choristocarpus tenellus]